MTRGSTGVSSTGGSGTYNVTFPSNINACAWITTVATGVAQASASDTRLGFAEPALGASNAIVRVFTADKGGSTGVARPFHLTVFCP